MEEQVLYGDLNIERLKELADVKDAVFNETYELSVQVLEELQKENLPHFLHAATMGAENLLISRKKKEFIKQIERIIDSITGNINIQIRRTTYNAIQILESTR